MYPIICINISEGEVHIMTIDTNSMISITEANQNFSKVARVVDEHGTAVILKNNVPRYQEITLYVKIRDRVIF